MGLSEIHFDLVAQHLVESLLALGVQQHVIDEVVGIVAPLRAVFEKCAIRETTESSGSEPQEQESVVSAIDAPPEQAPPVHAAKNDEKSKKKNQERPKSPIKRVMQGLRRSISGATSRA